MIEQRYNSETIRAKYDEYYGRGKDFASLPAADRVLVKMLSQRLNLRPGLRLLDVPCGTGKFTALFAQQGLNVLGVDISSVGIQVAQQRFPAIPFQVEDAFEMSFEEKFDVLFCHGFSPFNTANLNELVPVVRRLGGLVKDEGLFIFGKTSSLTDRPSKTGSRIDYSLASFTEFFSQLPCWKEVLRATVIPQLLPVLKGAAFGAGPTLLTQVAARLTRQPVRVYLAYRLSAR